MNIAEWLFENMARLKQAGVDSPRRDCLVLLEDILGKDRTWVTTHPEYEIPANELAEVNQMILQRIDRVPLAYIRKRAWFYGRFFDVNQNVLIPRPESENIIDILKSLDQTKFNQLFDIGTGSGCLAITARLELENLDVFASDISKLALDIAKQNAKKHSAKITLLESDLLKNITDDINSSTVLVANLPYVPEGLITSKEIMLEPNIALFSGKDGLDLYKEFWNQISALKIKPSLIITESLETQHKSMTSFAEKSDYKLAQTVDLIQAFSL